MNFEWDDNKATTNLIKHGISFEEAQTVFDDPLFVDFFDPDHSENEQRYLMIGHSDAGNLLIVSYTERGRNNRLISARKVTKREKQIYEEG